MNPNYQGELGKWGYGNRLAARGAELTRSDRPVHPHSLLHLHRRLHPLITHASELAGPVVDLHSKESRVSCICPRIPKYA